ncbi:MAG: hypothetical protein AAGJ87_10295 [Pseudomonadota bacterium]
MSFSFSMNADAADVSLSSAPLSRNAAERFDGLQFAAARPALFAAATAPVVFLVIVLVALAIFGAPDRSPASSRSLTPLVDASPSLQTLAQPPAYGDRRATQAQPVAMAHALSPPPAAASLPLAEDVAIIALGLDGSMLALYTDGPSGREIILFDLEAAVIRQRIAVGAAAHSLNIVRETRDRRQPTGELRAPSLSPARELQ